MHRTYELNHLYIRDQNLNYVAMNTDWINTIEDLQIENIVDQTMK